LLGGSGGEAGKTGKQEPSKGKKWVALFLIVLTNQYTNANINKPINVYLFK
jgi:hypothetical protein